jgi:lipopolysaccharide transport system permease protein
MPQLARRRHTVDLVAHLVAREFRLRYRRPLFGWVWAVAEPLARLLVLSFLFSRLLPLDIPDYPAFLFTGLIAWTWFASGVSGATTAAVDRQDLLHRPGFPRAAVPVVSVLASGLDYLAALPVLAGFLLFSGGIPLTASLLPFILAPQVLLTVGLGFALCACNVHLRDTRLVVNLALTVGFYVTPVFYSEADLGGRFSLFFDLNPMARLLAMQRDILVAGHLPDGSDFLLTTGLCAVVTLAGYAIFRTASPTLVDEL